MKKLTLIVTAFLISLPAFGQWKIPQTTAECLARPMKWLEDPGYGNPVDDEKIEAACSASSYSQPDTEGPKGSICMNTIADIQNGYNEIVRKKREACALVDQFMPKSGCRSDASPADQAKCFKSVVMADQNAKNQVNDLLRSITAHRENVRKAIPMLSQAAKKLAEIGRNLTEESEIAAQDPSTPTYSEQAKNNANKLGASDPWAGTKKINPNMQMTAADFEKYKQFIDRLVGSTVTESDRNAIREIPSPHLRQQAMAIYKAKKFTQAAEIEAQEQQSISQGLSERQMEVADVDMRSMGNDSGFNMNQAIQGTALANQAAAMQRKGGGGAVSGGGANGAAPALGGSAVANVSIDSDPDSAKSGWENLVGTVDGTKESKSGNSVETKDELAKNTPNVAKEDKKSLRDKLKGRTNRSGSSRMLASSMDGDAPALDENGEPVLDRNGNPVSQAKYDEAVRNGDAEALASFTGSNLGGGLELAGSETDEMVETLVDEMKDALGLDLGSGNSLVGAVSSSGTYPSGESKEIQSAREILAADSKGLFERIRVLHHRCLQKGCVLGKQSEAL